jgi:sterol desaturase/sphingolipid hydroxylase (fatty acid hydroxylase superfamily)
LAPYAFGAHAAGFSATTTLAVHLALKLVWLGIAERRWQHRPEWRADAAALRRDGIFFASNVLADAVGGLVVRSAALWWLSRTAADGWAHGLPAWAAVPLAILVSEFSAYWLHRWSHAGGWLWRVHSVHHRPELINLFSNLTTHPINVLLIKLAKMLPLMLLGFDAGAVLWARNTEEPAAVGVASPEKYPASTDWPGLMRWPLTH